MVGGWRLLFVGLPPWLQVYYAGPAKTPAGYASGSFGPTTAGRMDAYVDRFMAAGGSFVTLAKGNRSKAVTQACKKVRLPPGEGGNEMGSQCLFLFGGIG